VVQAALVYLPLIQLGPAWISQPGFLAGSALLMLPPLLGWTVFGAVVGSVVWVHVVGTGQIYDIVFNSVTALISGLIVFGVMSLTRLVAELAETRTQLAKMAVSEERLRFARDLHDLLGLSLSAMTLKSELTLRLMDIDPDKAAEELVEILGWPDRHSPMSARWPAATGSCRWTTSTAPRSPCSPPLTCGFGWTSSTPNCRCWSERCWRSCSARVSPMCCGTARPSTATS